MTGPLCRMDFKSGLLCRAFENKYPNPMVLRAYADKTNHGSAKLTINREKERPLGPRKFTAASGARGMALDTFGPGALFLKLE